MNGETLERATISAPPPGPDRTFSVLRKGINYEKIVAEHCQILDNGALVFTTGGNLVKAIATGSWKEIEEVEGD